MIECGVQGLCQLVLGKQSPMLRTLSSWRSVDTSCCVIVSLMSSCVKLVHVVIDSCRTKLYASLLVECRSAPVDNIWAVAVVSVLKEDYQNCSALYCVTQLCTVNKHALMWTVLTGEAPGGLRGCKSRAHPVSWPEVVKGVLNHGLDCFLS